MGSESQGARRPRSFGARGLVLGLSLAAFACGTTSAQAPGTDAARAKASATKAPDFNIDTISGDAFRLSDHLGKEVIVIDFWATWCQPCVAVLQHLERVYEKDKGLGLVVIAVAIDDAATAGEVPRFARAHNMNFAVAHDAQSRVTDLYNKKSIAPYQVLIGRDGRIIKERDSYEPGDEVGMEQDINEALAAK